MWASDFCHGGAPVTKTPASGTVSLPEKSVSSFAMVVDETGTDAGACTIDGLAVPA